MPPKKKACWEWRNDDNKWVRYPAKDGVKMEEAFQAGKTVLRTADLSFNGGYDSLYHYNFTTMTQLNTESRTKRDIRRKVLKAKAKAKPKAKAKRKRAPSKTRSASDESDDDGDDGDADEDDEDADEGEDEAEKNAIAFAKLAKPMQIGSVSWDGGEIELVAAIDKGITDLQKLLDDALSFEKTSKQPAGHEPAPAGAEPRGGSVVTVKALSGQSTEIALTPASTVSDLKLKVASWLEMMPCQFVMVQGTSRLADHEVVSVSGGVLDVVIRNITSEAKALAGDLACCARATKQAGFAVCLPGTDAAGLPGALHRLYVFASKPLLRTTMVDPDLGMWAARILEGISWEGFSELGLYEGIRKSEIDKEGQRLGLEPPLMLLGHALKASDGGISAAAIFPAMCFGERWCAASVGEALMGHSWCHKKMLGSATPGVGSSLATAFREIIAHGPEAAALDCLCTCIAASTVDLHCSVPAALAGMAGSAAAAWKEGGRKEPEVRRMAAALLVALINPLWPGPTVLGRGTELCPKTKAASEILLKDLVSAGLADPITKKLLPPADEMLIEKKVCETLGLGDLGDLSCGDYKHEVGTPGRPSSWTPES